jgi:hypothetical protein
MMKKIEYGIINDGEGFAISLSTLEKAVREELSKAELYFFDGPIHDSDATMWLMDEDEVEKMIDKIIAHF